MSPVVVIKRFARRRPWSAVLSSMAVLVSVVAVYQVVELLTGSFDVRFGLVLAVPRVLEWTLIVAGLVAVARGMPYRSGASLHCARCGYQRVEERDRLLVNCPECGHHWRLFGGWRTGRPLGDPRMVKVGLIVCFAGLAAILGRNLAGPWLAQRLSTAMLIKTVLYAPVDSAGGMWDILDGRALTADQVRWVGEDLLRRRRATGLLDYRSAEWLHKRIGDGTLPADLTQRYIDEALDFWVEVPGSAVVGEPFDAALRTLYRGPGLATPLGRITYVVDGVSIELPGRPAGDQASDFEKRFRTGPLVIGPRGQSDLVQDPLEARRPSTVASVRTSGQFAGTAKVRAVVWVLVGATPYEQVSWAGQDAQRSPRTTSVVNRAIRREIEREVEITPLK